MAGLPGDLILQYQDAFANFDEKNNGLVPTKKLGAVLKFVGENPSESEVQDLMMEVDSLASGAFQFPSFLTMMSNKHDSITAEDEIRESFKVFDRAGNGYINRQELRFVMMNLGESMPEDEIEYLIDEIDQDGDGQINYEEFYLMMTSTT
jgi:calmodulin